MSLQTFTRYVSWCRRGSIESVEQVLLRRFLSIPVPDLSYVCHASEEKCKRNLREVVCTNKSYKSYIVDLSQCYLPRPFFPFYLMRENDVRSGKRRTYGRFWEDRPSPFVLAALDLIIKNKKSSVGVLCIEFILSFHCKQYKTVPFSFSYTHLFSIYFDFACVSDLYYKMFPQKIWFNIIAKNRI